MMALTMHQPWDVVICLGSKRVENRNWEPPPGRVGKFIAIHAGKTWDEKGAEFIVELLGSNAPPLEKRPSGIVGIARIVGVVHDESDDEHFASLMDPEDEKWFFGPIGWVLRNAIAIPTVECRGMQKLWTVPRAIAEEVERRARAAKAVGRSCAGIAGDSGTGGYSVSVDVAAARLIDVPPSALTDYQRELALLRSRLILDWQPASATSRLETLTSALPQETSS